MKNYKQVTLTLLIAVLCSNLAAQELTATEVIEKADDKFYGEKSSVAEMKMTIVRPSWERTVEFKSWNEGTDKSLTLITAPASEKGQTFLKRGNEMWSWNPSISRLIKLPPSMMSQGWMGSDYTNDDILQESSIVNDYTHEIVGEDTIEGRTCYKIKLTAKEESAVIWGHQLRWIDKDDFLFLKAELYDFDGYLIRTETAGRIREMDGRLIPTRMVLLPEEEEGHKTILLIEDIDFNVSIPDQFFSQQNMKQVRR